MKNLSVILFLFIIQPIFVLAAPPNLPENWQQMIVASPNRYSDEPPKQHICMMKQPNLPEKEMNCFSLTFEFGVTGFQLFYADDGRFRPIGVSCYCGNDNAPDHDYWLEAIGKKTFAPLYKGDGLRHPRYPAYRYFLNANKQIIPKNKSDQQQRKWECFAQQKGQYRYCRMYDPNDVELLSKVIEINDEPK